MKCSSLVTFGLLLLAAGLLGIALTGCGSSTAQADRAQAVEPKDQPKSLPALASEEHGKGMAAIKKAADAGKYLFVFFSKTNDEQTLAMRSVFDQAMEKVTDRAQTATVNVTDVSENAIVEKFGLNRAA